MDGTDTLTRPALPAAGPQGIGTARGPVPAGRVPRAGRVRAGRVLALSLGLAALLALPACDTLRSTFGGGKQPPDEFAVLSRAPLTLPPDFQLRPPAPGMPRPQDEAPGIQAQSALFGGPVSGVVPAPGGVAVVPEADLTALTAGERSLLQMADADQVDPNIRRIVNQETTALIEGDRRFIDRLVFWQSPQVPGEVVDATRERERLQETSARGQPPTTGTTPTIERRQRGILEGIF